jgi:tRNA(adenine34) deaminase
MQFDLMPLESPLNPFHRHHMGLARAMALEAMQADEVPVGCVIVSLERQAVIAQARNEREQLQDPTAHAEILAITQAAAALRSWRLEKCILYVTLEPCPMCAGAIVQARIPIVVYGARDAKAGACHSLYEITSDPRLNHRCQVIGDVEAEECARLLSEFFAAKRAMGKK